MDPCAYSPIWYNPDFYFNKKPLFYSNWNQCGISHLYHLLCDNTFISFEDLTANYAIPRGEFIQYLHIKEVIRSKVNIKGMVHFEIKI